MKHLLQVDSELTGLETYLDVFQCDNEPGMCDDWEADGGGNKCVISTKLATTDVESKLAPDTTNIINSDDAYFKSDCAGAFGDQPIWIQGDETPTCACNKKMKFVLQLEEQVSDEFNFGGGGVAYLFCCISCKSGKFLWQC